MMVCALWWMCKGSRSFVRYFVRMSAEDHLDDLDRWFERERLERVREDAHELADAERSEVELLDRVAGAVGAAVTVGLVSGRAYEGRVRRVGRDWIELDALHPPRRIIVNAQRIAWLSGRLSRVRPADERHPRLRIRSAVQGLAETGRRAVLVTVAGDFSGVVARVFADHLELRVVKGSDASTPSRGLTSVPFSSLEALWVV